MSEPSNPVVVHYDTEELDPLSPEQTFVLKEFKKYKFDSLNITTDNFITPNEGIQEREPSVHSLFGRDRVFEKPSDLITGIHRENVAHIHYSDGSWTSDMKQWYCTSNLALVYSGFELKDKFHFVVHELLLNEDSEPDFDAHDSYEREDVEFYIENAEYLRKAVEKQSENDDD
ncbi:type II toxin-antitoxin system YafO family toxin [Vibrio splendidus]